MRCAALRCVVAKELSSKIYGSGNAKYVRHLLCATQDVATKRFHTNTKSKLTQTINSTRESEQYDNGDNSSDGEDSRRRVAQQTSSLIQQEFASRRKGKGGEGKKGDEAESAKWAKVRAAESTGVKVSIVIADPNGCL